MNAHLKRDVALARELDLAAVGTRPRPRRVHDRRKCALRLRHGEDAVEAARAPGIAAHVLQADVVDVGGAGRQLRFRREPRVDRQLRERLLRRRPERVEVRRVLDRRLDPLGRVGRRPHRPVLAASHAGRHHAAQEAGLLHRPRLDREAALGQGRLLLDRRRHHLRSAGVAQGRAGERVPVARDRRAKPGRGADRVAPVRAIRDDRHPHRPRPLLGVGPRSDPDRPRHRKPRCQPNARSPHRMPSSASTVDGHRGAIIGPPGRVVRRQCPAAGRRIGPCRDGGPDEPTRSPEDHPGDGRGRGRQAAAGRSPHRPPPPSASSTPPTSACSRTTPARTSWTS